MIKKIVVFGATGLAGKQIVKEAVKAGQDITIYTRQMDFVDKSVKIITGELNEKEKIQDLISQFDVIVSAIGNRDYAEDKLLVSPFLNLVSQVLKSHQRLIIVSGSGLTLNDACTLRRDLPGQPEFLKFQREDHWLSYCHIAPLDINYLFICPTMMVEGDCDGRYLHQEKYFPKSDIRQVFAGNVADFIIKEITAQKYTQTRIGLVNG